jgi:RND family efflux transporter MFP subunit
MRGSTPALVPLVLAAGLTACGQAPAQQASGMPAVPVKVAQVDVKPVEEFSEYVATLKSRRSIALNPQVDGQVRRIYVKSGDAVKAGQPLVQLDQARQAALVRNQEATRLARQADLEYARQQYERLKTLSEQGIISRQQLDQAKSTLEATRASVEALEASVREEQVRLRYFTITAPVDGIVGDIPVRVGGYVTPQTTLTTIDQNTALEAYVSVPLERAPDLKVGMPIVLVDRDGRKIADSRVYFISPQVNDETQSVLIKALVDNPDGRLRADQFVRARVVWSTRRGPTVPVVAVSRLNGQTFVFVAQEEKGALIARQRPVEVGEIVGQEYPVLKGLSPGDRVVVSGIQKLRDGAPIAVAPEA